MISRFVQRSAGTHHNFAARTSATLSTLAGCIALAATLTGCESGLARTARVSVTSSDFSNTQRGLVVSDLGGTVRPWVVLCGQSLPQTLVLEQNLGFGCLDENLPAETVRVWIEPIGDSTTFACSSSGPFYGPLSFSDAGGPFASSPEAGWVQGSSTATWQRDASPCGGSLRAVVNLTR